MYDVNKITNNIIFGDCIEELKKISDCTVDLIFADQPYFMQTEGELKRTDGSKFAGVEDEWDKFKNYNEYDEFCFNWLKECQRVLKKDGTIWVIGAFQNIYRLGYIMQNLGYWVLNDVVWSKPNAAPNFGGTRFQNSHETLLWCSKSKNSKYTFNYKTMKYLNGDKQDKSVWDIGICIGNERIKDENGKKAHSTQKPEKLLYKIILSSSKPDAIILDPFFGSGTTGAIAKRLGRNFIGIEREKKYIDVARKRIDNVIPEFTELHNLALETKPPRVPIEKLLTVGYLTEGQKLYSADKKVEVILTKNGTVKDNEDELSIHKMSAKYLNKSNNNGWGYFWVDFKNEFIPIDKLRYLYQEVQNG
jgi:site-specific DNA-methyltransferase (adenine-specific)